MKKQSLTLNDYFDSLFGNKLSSIKTIDRTWRKIQEETPILRGKKWGERQKQSGKIRDTIPTLFDNID